MGKAIRDGWLIAGILLLFLAACRNQPQTVREEAPSPASLPAATLPPPQINNTVDTPPPAQNNAGSDVSAALPQPTPAPPPTERWLGQSPGGQPLIAHRIGFGQLNVAIVGVNHTLAGELLAALQSKPQDVPANVSLWILPDLNPDGEQRGVDLLRNADTDLDGCPGNEWSPNPDDRQGAGGTYPFSEPESVELEGFLQGVWLAFFLQKGASSALTEPRILPGGCWLAANQFAPNRALAQLFSSQAKLTIASAESDSGNWFDYLVGEGVASIRVELPAAPVDPNRFLPAIRASLLRIDDISGADSIEANANFEWLHQHNVGVWRFPPGTFIHPIALTVLGETAYLQDSGRVLAIDLQQPTMPQTILQPNDRIVNEWVDAPALEPFDLAAADEALLALDRVGDVYRLEGGAWQMERYDRPISEASSHYFTALTAGDFGRFLLENSYDFINQYNVPYSTDTGWRLDDHFQVDVAARGEFVYLLYRERESVSGGMLRYQNLEETTIRDNGFRSSAPLFRPRQLVVGDFALYALDYAGRRLLTINLERGSLLSQRQFLDRREFSTFWVEPTGQRMIFAGKDTLYFVGEPNNNAQIEGEGEMPATALNDPATLRSLRGWLVPIAGSPLTQRDLQMPGAPRHYRLGIHEGVDFYWSAGTQVRAAAEGVVLRATHDYTLPDEAQIAQWRQESWALGMTSPAALDGFRGRQVWIQHENGMVSRYVHLGGIEPNVVEGARVERGQLIAQVGNSGSPGSIAGINEDAHLHFELWLNEHYLGQSLRPIEVREWLERIFTR